MKKKFYILKSIYYWTCTILLFILWFFIMFFIWILEKNPLKIKTSECFRYLGIVLTKLNPFLKIKIYGKKNIINNGPFVIIVNHQSLADIPVLSNISLNAKWSYKKSLIKVPLLGQMILMMRGIQIDKRLSKINYHIKDISKKYIENKISIIFFPEGTRSPDGKIKKFSSAAFTIAISLNIPILPIIIYGTHELLPKKSFKFRGKNKICVNILPIIETKNITLEQKNIIKKSVYENMCFSLEELSLKCSNTN